MRLLDANRFLKSSSVNKASFLMTFLRPRLDRRRLDHGHGEAMFTLALSWAVRAREAMWGHGISAAETLTREPLS
jgi:hypothetical protein